MKANNDGEFPQTLEFEKYQYSKVLGRGGQGVVCEYIDTKTKNKVAVKFDNTNGGDILGECLFLKNHGQTLKHAPKYILHSCSKGRRFLVMQYLEYSI